MTHPTAAVVKHPHGISSIDCLYLAPSIAASHLIVHGGRAAFVDAGANSSVPGLLQALAAQGIAREQVDLILLTHVHLDHAGGAGLLASELPNAQVVVHPRGARHLIDPTKLIEGSIGVYGAEAYARLYGEIRPIPESRVRSAEDGLTLSLAGRPLHLFHTPGHALHHLCIHDPTAGAVFTGDTFGISYRHTDTARGPFLFPTTTPVQFDPDALRGSIERIMALSPESVYLTHYSRIGDVQRLGRELLGRLSAFAGIAQASPAGPERSRHIEAGLWDYLHRELDLHGVMLSREERRKLLGPDLRIDADGMAIWMEKAKKA
jgi:glyoxylase-like metal-dependent hydrolase (beta-lactamase superfamily II)